MVIDVSKWQGNIDWAKVKKAGITSVYVKATEGVNYKDPLCTQHSHGASANGIALGYYHFASLNNQDVTKDALAEANDFVSFVKTLPKPSMPLALDIESNAAKIKPADVLVWIKTFFAELERLCYSDYVLYSYAPFLNENLPAGHGLGNIRLWIAAYTDKPKLPKGWSEYWLWQYSQTGKIDGIKGNVDLNKAQ